MASNDPPPTPDIPNESDSELSDPPPTPTPVSRIERRVTRAEVARNIQQHLAPREPSLPPERRTGLGRGKSVPPNINRFGNPIQPRQDSQVNAPRGRGRGRGQLPGHPRTRATGDDPPDVGPFAQPGAETRGGRRGGGNAELRRSASPPATRLRPPPNFGEGQGRSPDLNSMNYMAPAPSRPAVAPPTFIEVPNVPPSLLPPCEHPDGRDIDRMPYYDDSPQYLSETANQWKQRVENARRHMGILRKTPVPDEPVRGPNETERSLRSRYDAWKRNWGKVDLLHQSTMTPEDNLYNEQYTIDWMQAFDYRTSHNARMRAQGLAARRQFDAERGLPLVPTPPYPPAEEHGERWDYEMSRDVSRTAEGRARLRKAAEQDLASLEASKAYGNNPKFNRCKVCELRKVKCDVMDTGFPCSYCMKHKLPCTDGSKNVFPRKRKFGTKKGSQDPNQQTRPSQAGAGMSSSPVAFPSTYRARRVTTPPRPRSASPSPPASFRARWKRCNACNIFDTYFDDVTPCRNCGHSIFVPDAYNLDRVFGEPAEDNSVRYNPDNEDDIYGGSDNEGEIPRGNYGHILSTADTFLDARVTLNRADENRTIKSSPSAAQGAQGNIRPFAATAADQAPGWPDQRYSQPPIQQPFRLLGDLQSMTSNTHGFGGRAESGTRATENLNEAAATWATPLSNADTTMRSSPLVNPSGMANNVDTTMANNSLRDFEGDIEMGGSGPPLTTRDPNFGLFGPQNPDQPLDRDQIALLAAGASSRRLPEHLIFPKRPDIPNNSSNYTRNFEYLPPHWPSTYKTTRNWIRGNMFDFSLDCNEVENSFWPDGLNYGVDVSCRISSAKGCEIAVRHQRFEMIRTCRPCHTSQNRYMAPWEQMVIEQTKAYVCHECAEEARRKFLVRDGNCHCAATLKKGWYCHDHRRDGISHFEAWAMTQQQNLASEVGNCSACYVLPAEPHSQVWGCVVCREWVAI